MEPMFAVVREIDPEGSRTLVIKTDVTKEEDCARLMTAAIEKFNRIDYLMNNAGASMWQAFCDMQDLTVLSPLKRFINGIGQMGLICIMDGKHIKFKKLF